MWWTQFGNLPIGSWIKDWYTFFHRLVIHTFIKIRLAFTVFPYIFIKINRNYSPSFSWEDPSDSKRSVAVGPIIYDNSLPSIVWCNIKQYIFQLVHARSRTADQQSLWALITWYWMWHFELVTHSIHQCSYRCNLNRCVEVIMGSDLKWF